MEELSAAMVSLQFFAARSPPDSVFVEVSLVGPEGRTVWFNGGARILAAPPWESE